MTLVAEVSCTKRWQAARFHRLSRVTSTHADAGDCRHYQSRTYASGEGREVCVLDGT